MAGSSAEREIRDAVVAWCRAKMPTARVIHELIVGGRRADLAAVEPMYIVLFEIKSERDTLDRLDHQMRAFVHAAHEAVLVAHDRWFDHTPYPDGRYGLRFEHDSLRYRVWCYPEPDPSAALTASFYAWRLSSRRSRRPPPGMLDLLWSEELLEEGRIAGVPVRTRMNISDLITTCAWGMTGEQLTRAACRQLRKRAFAEADPPMSDAPAPGPLFAEARHDPS
jgi:hypothetical protein